MPEFDPDIRTWHEVKLRGVPAGFTVFKNGRYIAVWDAVNDRHVAWLATPLHRLTLFMLAKHIAWSVVFTLGTRQLVEIMSKINLAIVILRERQLVEITKVITQDV